jgi:hypothetical protein
MKRLICIFAFLLFPALIQAQTKTTTITASVSDDGLPTSQINCTWTRTAGPTSAVIATPTFSRTGITAWPVAVSTLVTFTAAGAYTFHLDCFDSQLRGVADVSFTVAPFNIAPTITITSPANGSTIAENTTAPINATATNASEARLFINDKQVFAYAGPTDGHSFEYQWLTPNSPGSSSRTYILRAEAENAEGTKASAASSVTVR